MLIEYIGTSATFSIRGFRFGSDEAHRVHEVKEEDAAFLLSFKLFRQFTPPLAEPSAASVQVEEVVAPKPIKQKQPAKPKRARKKKT